MRLEKLTISGFRGFCDERTVPMGANVVILQGPNGSGKTSLIDAIQWLLLGDIVRFQDGVLKKSEDYISNRYAGGPPFVDAELASDEGPVRVSRRGLGESMQVQVDRGDDRLIGEEAQRWLDATMGAGSRELDPAELLRRHLLQQDDMREFLQADTKERYEFVASLTGMERLTSLDNQLTNELKTIRKATRELEAKVEKAEAELDTASADRLDSRELLGERARPVDLEQTRRRGASLLGKEELSERGADLAAALAARSDEILEGLERMEELKSHLRLSREHARQVSDPDEGRLADLRAQTETLAKEESRAREDLAKAEKRLEEAKLTADKAQQLAALALEQIEGDCPVCGQKHDAAETRAHLERLLQDSPKLADDSVAVDSARQGLASIATRRAGADSDLAALEDAVLRRRAMEESTERLEAESEQARTSVEELVGQVAQTPGLDELQQLAKARRAEIDAELTVLRRGLARELDNRRATRRVTAIEEQVGHRREHLDELNRALAEQRAKVKRAENVRSNLGGMITAVMKEVANGSTDLINEIYRRLDVHPTFQEFGFHTQRHRETGHLRPWVYDRRREKEGDALHVLSAAQLNSLAICLFLALNLESRSGLSTAILDDPVQSLDDINLLSLADVLRTVRASRQVIVSTHDETLAELLIRKLRPLKSNDATMIVTIDQWGEAGPRVSSESRERVGLELELELLSEKSS